MLVGTAGDGAVDGQRPARLAGARAVRADERHQDLLLQVGQVDAVEAEAAAVCGQHVGRLVRCEQVRGGQQPVDELLAATTRPGGAGR